MKQMGALGTTFASVGLAGCGGSSSTKNGNGNGNGTDGSATKPVETNLPKDRKAPTFTHITSPQDYWAERYESVSIVDKKLTDGLGLHVKTKGLPFSAWPAKYKSDEFGFVSSNWSSGDGDPSSQLVMTFSSDGVNNHWGYANDKYDKVALAQRRETDRKKRQALVKKAQKILGETRPESELVHNYRTHAFNNSRIKKDSIETTFYGLRNIWNYVSMQPKNDDGKTIITNNFAATDSVNPLHINTLKALRNIWAVQLTHDYLYRMGPDSSAKAWAAKSHDWKDDTTLSVTLRQDLVAHDGKAITADDVTFTYDLILNKKPAFYKAFVNDVIDSVEKKGQYEVEFSLKKPYAPIFNSTFGRVPILPKHHWESLMKKTGNEDKPWNISFADNEMIGSGAFEFGAWDQGSKVEFPAFKKHFNAPNIDKRIERTLASREAESKAFVQGKYDLLETWFGSPSDLKKLTDKHDNLTFVKALADTRMAMWANCDRAPLSDVTMRQAVNAVVRSVQPTIINEVFDGIGEKARSPISPALAFWYNENTPVFDVGVDGAVKMLKDAGYKWDKDGNLYMPKGMTSGG